MAAAAASHSPVLRPGPAAVTGAAGDAMTDGIEPVVPAAVAAGEETVEIHRPRPIHGWRDFAKEVATIVLGVLLALAGEQVVETLRERALRTEAREAIEGEIRRNLDIFRRRGEVQPCIDRRLREIEGLLVAAPGAPLPRPLWIGRPQVWSINTSRLAAATSGARTALLPPALQASYSEVYSGLAVVDTAQGIEQLAWARLRSLETLPALDGASRFALTEALHEARYANFRILVAAAQTRKLAGALGLAAEPSPYAAGSRSACVPLATPRAEALRQNLPDRATIAEP